MTEKYLSVPLCPLLRVKLAYKNTGIEKLFFYLLYVYVENVLSLDSLIRHT